MTASPAPRAALRDPLIDALRALAIIGVVTVNWVGYSMLLGDGALPIGAPFPADSPWAQAVWATLLVICQGKAYPLLCFLFGYSMVLSRRARGRDPQAARAHRRQRMGRLALLGVLHGCLVYAGDILLAYSVVGAGLLFVFDGKATRWLTCLRIWGGIFLATVALMGLGLWMAGDQMAGQVDAPQAFHASAAGTWLAANAKHYATACLGTLFMLPELLALALMGALTARLRIWQHPRWPRRFKAHWIVAGVVLVPACLGVNLHSVHAALNQGPLMLSGTLDLMPNALFSLWLATGVAWFGSRQSGWVRWLAPAGRHTLTMYLTSSLLGMLVFTPVGLNLQPGTVVAAAMALSYWALCMMLARQAQAQGWTGPFERFLNR